eukprot:1624503-Pyramimonas_sp.AAC.1
MKYIQPAVGGIGLSELGRSTMSASHSRSSSMSLAQESACFAATSDSAYSMRGAWWRSLGGKVRRRILT